MASGRPTTRAPALPSTAAPSLSPTVASASPALLTTARARVVARARIDEARQSSREGLDDPRIGPMRSFYAGVTGVGEPVLTRVGSRPGAFRVPVMAGDRTVGEMVLHPGTGRVIQWPVRVVHREGTSDLVPRRTFTVVDTFAPDWVPSIAFYAPPAAATMDPCMLDAIELGPIQKLVGIPMRPWDVTGRLLAHIEATAYAKQLKEDPGWVARVNRVEGRRWRVAAGPRSVSAKCWSYAFSYAIDWWNQEYGRSTGRHRSFLTGRGERGFDPRLLDLAYRKRAHAAPDRFLFVPPVFMEDPVTGEPVLSSMEALAGLVARPGRMELVEPEAPRLLGRRRLLDGARLPMEGHHVRLFGLNEASHDSIVRALHQHGVVIAGEVHRFRGCPLLYSTHAAPIVGAGRLLGAPVLVYLDSLFAPGGREPRLRLYPASMFSEAYAFPHTLRVTVRPSRPGPRRDIVRLDIELANQGGRRIADADGVWVEAPGLGRSWPARLVGRRYVAAVPLKAAAEASGRLRVRALRRYYYGPAGTGAAVDVTVDTTP